MAQDKLIGSTLSHFRIESKLGEGGMGRVYLATDQRLRRPVAVKMLSPSLVRDKQALHRLQLEAIAASAINHPNICTIYEIDAFRGQPFIVMEYIEGGTLRDELKRQGVLPPMEIIRLFEQICPALSLAHKAGIVHLDLKPDNIMMCTRTGMLKITDFGLARLASESAHQDMIRTTLTPPDSMTDPHQFAMTLTGIMGTAAYMSPEQALRSDIGHRADIFVLGILLYELATGRNPFLADDHLSTLRNIQAVNETIVESAGIPSHLEPIVSHCLQASPDNRYDDVDSLLSDLQKTIKYYRVTARLSIWQKQVKHPPRKSLKWAAAIVMLSLLALAVLFTLPQWKHSRAILEKRDAASTDALELTTSSAQAYQLFKQGQQDYWRYATRDAIENLQLAVSLDSSFAYAQVLLGMLLKWEDRLDEADKCFQIAARHIAQLVGAERLFVLGMISYSADNSTLMLNPLLALTKQYPNHIDGLLSAALAYEKLHDYDKAMDYTRRVIAVDSTHIAAYGNMADLLEWTGRYEEALGYANKQLDLIVSSGDPRGLEAAAEAVGRLHHFLDHPFKSVKYLQQSLDIDPLNRDASLYLAESYALQNRLADAVKVLQDAITRPIKTKSLANLFTSLARLRAFEGRYVDALAACNKAATLDPKSLLAFIGERKTIFIEMNQPELIAQDISRIAAALPKEELDNSPRFAELNFAHYLLLGDIEKSSQWHTKHAELMSSRNSIGMEIDMAIFRREFEHAQNLLTKRISGNPAYAMGAQLHAYAELASIYLQEEDYGRAIAVCESGLRTRHILGGMDRAVSFPKLLALSSETYEAMGLYDKSLEMCDRFMSYWANADPNIPLLLEMQERRARLEQQLSAKDIGIQSGR